MSSRQLDMRIWILERSRLKAEICKSLAPGSGLKLTVTEVLNREGCTVRRRVRLELFLKKKQIFIVYIDR